MRRGDRTERFCYEWLDFKTSQLVASELYDHGAEPLETVNVFTQKEYAAAVAYCRRLYS